MKMLLTSGGIRGFPHLNYLGWDSNTMAAAEKWFSNMDVPAYAIDDQTAIAVDGDDVTVVSEEEWRYFG